MNKQRQERTTNQTSKRYLSRQNLSEWTISGTFCLYDQRLMESSEHAVMRAPYKHTEHVTSWDIHSIAS